MNHHASRCVTVTEDMIREQNARMDPALPAELAAWLQAQGIDTRHAAGEQVDPADGAARLAAQVIGQLGAVRVAAGLSGGPGSYLWQVATGLAELEKLTPDENAAERSVHGHDGSFGVSRAEADAIATHAGERIRARARA